MISELYACLRGQIRCKSPSLQVKSRIRFSRVPPLVMGSAIQNDRGKSFPFVVAILTWAKATCPPTSLPALDLAASAYAADRVVGERVSMALRTALFEDGLDISRPDVLQTIASQEGAPPPSPGARDQVQADWRDGQARDVSGSPHWFVGEADFFCPSLEIERVGGHLQIHTDPAAFDAFLKTCLAL